MSGGQIRDGIVRSRSLFTPGFSQITPGNTMFRGISLDGAGTSPIVNKRRGLLSRSTFSIGRLQRGQTLLVPVIVQLTKPMSLIILEQLWLRWRYVLSIIKNIRSQSIHSWALIRKIRDYCANDCQTCVLSCRWVTHNGIVHDHDLISTTSGRDTMPTSSSPIRAAHAFFRGTWSPLVNGQYSSKRARRGTRIYTNHILNRCETPAIDYYGANPIE